MVSQGPQKLDHVIMSARGVLVHFLDEKQTQL